MKKIILITLSLLFCINSFCQNKPYNDKIDGEKQIKEAVAKAKQENKNVVCQVGGNWCKWCLRFTEFADNTKSIKDVVDKNFILIHVNYSKENKNIKAMKMLSNPERFGFPVFVVLDSNGKVIHIQDSSFLEKDDGYDEQKTLRFLSNWTKHSVENINLK